MSTCSYSKETKVFLADAATLETLRTEDFKLKHTSRQNTTMETFWKKQWNLSSFTGFIPRFDSRGRRRCTHSSWGSSRLGRNSSAARAEHLLDDKLRLDRDEETPQIEGSDREKVSFSLLSETHWWREQQSVGTNTTKHMWGVPFSWPGRGNTWGAFAAQEALIVIGGYCNWWFLSLCTAGTKSSCEVVWSSVVTEETQCVSSGLQVNY